MEEFLFFFSESAEIIIEGEKTTVPLDKTLIGRSA
jgi:hypothetical protein